PQRGQPLLRILQERPKRSDTFRLCSGRVQVAAAQRGEYMHLEPRTRDGDVQPPPSALPVERAEVHGYLAGGVRAVPDREQNNVALIPLNILQVFHENRLMQQGSGLLQ